MFNIRNLIIKFTTIFLSINSANAIVRTRYISRCALDLKIGDLCIIDTSIMISCSVIACLLFYVIKVSFLFIKNSYTKKVFIKKNTA